MRVEICGFLSRTRVTLAFQNETDLDTEGEVRQTGKNMFFLFRFGFCVAVSPKLLFSASSARLDTNKNFIV